MFNPQLITLLHHESNITLSKEIMTSYIGPIIRDLFTNNEGLSRVCVDFFTRITSSKSLIIHRQQFFKDAIAHENTFTEIYELLMQKPAKLTDKIRKKLSTIIESCQSPAILDYYESLCALEFDKLALLHDVAVSYEATNVYEESMQSLESRFLEKSTLAFAIARCVNIFIDLVGKMKGRLVFPEISNLPMCLEYKGLYSLTDLFAAKEVYPQHQYKNYANTYAVNGSQNSGKTTLITSIIQSKYLMQLGFPVAAEGFLSSIANAINLAKNTIEYPSRYGLMIVEDNDSLELDSIMTFLALGNQLLLDAPSQDLINHIRKESSSICHKTSILQKYYRFVEIAPCNVT